MAFNETVVRNLLTDIIGKQIQAESATRRGKQLSWGTVSMSTDEIVLSSTIDAQGARVIQTIKVDVFAQRILNVAAASTAPTPTDFTGKQVKAVDPNDNLGYHQYIDDWVAQGYIPSS